jgi:hypothetical protein
VGSGFSRECHFNLAESFFGAKAPSHNIPFHPVGSGFSHECHFNLAESFFGAKAPSYTVQVAFQVQMHICSGL